MEETGAQRKNWSLYRREVIRKAIVITRYEIWKQRIARVIKKNGPSEIMNMMRVVR